MAGRSIDAQPLAGATGAAICADEAGLRGAADVPAADAGSMRVSSEVKP